MEIWKILMITLLSAVALGCLAGVVIGKYLLNREQSDRKPLLSLQERIIFLSCLVVGAACIIIGVFHPFAKAETGMPENPYDNMMPPNEELDVDAYASGEAQADGTADENPVTAGGSEEDGADLDQSDDGMSEEELSGEVPDVVDAEE